MDRREVIKLVSLSTGAILGAPLIGSLVSGCVGDLKKQDTNYHLVFFDKNGFTQVQTLIDLIIPETDSPSATGVGVDQIIDTIVGTIYSNAEKVSYKNNFDTLLDYLNRDGDFYRLNSEQKMRLLQELSRSDDKNTVKAKKAFLDLKQQSIAYYLTTETIAKNYLNYLPVPGKYEPCISLKEVGNKAWAL